MEKIVLLSDLWGKEKSEWINFYREILQDHFVVEFYDSGDLGNIDKTDYTEDKLHQQFVNGGIETAVKNLMIKENQPITILGFSVGGTIGWKAGLAGLKIDRLFAVSSTRIRNENKKPNTQIQLYYGENDAFKPKPDWYKEREITPHLFANENHNLYMKKEIATVICTTIIKQKKEL